MSYIGSSAAPLPIAFAGQQGQSFNGGTNTFTLSRAVSRTLDIDVVINNVIQSPYDGSYSVNGTTLTTAETVSAGVGNVYVIFRDAPIGSFSPIAGSVTPSSLSVGAPTWNSSGIVGVGVSPYGWQSGTGVIDLGNTSLNSITSAVGTAAGNALLANNAYFDGTNWKYKFGYYATMYSTGDGLHQWKYAASGTAGANITFAEAMRTDTSGNLLVGVTSVGGFGTKLLVGGDNGIGLSGGSGNINDNKLGRVRPIAAGTNPYAGGLAFDYYNYNGSSYVFMEGARLNGDGNWLVGTTTGNARVTVYRASGDILFADTAGGTGLVYRTSTSAGTAAYFITSAGQAGLISCSGGTTTYTSGSDYRLKDNIRPLTSGLSTVMRLNPVAFEWKFDGKYGESFVAHELAEVCPQAVVGEKDGVETYTDEDGNEQTRPKYQGIDTSFLVATLTAAIQEQQALIAQLQADVAALKA